MPYLSLGHEATVDQLQALNTVNGYYFFSKDTLRFFACRVYAEVWTRPEGWVFITSEKTGFDSSARAYTARIMSEDGNVDEFGGCSFGQFSSKRKAQRFIESVIKLEARS